MANFIRDVYEEEKSLNLQKAIRKNDSSMVQDLMIGLAVSENNDLYLQSVYKCAMRFGTSDVVKAFLDMPQYKNVGLSDLHLACLRNDIANAKLILQTQKHTLDQAVSSRSEHWAGFTSLHFGVAYKHPQIIELLLSFDADIKILDDKRMTPLCHAIAGKDQIILKLLLLYASKKNIFIINGQPLLHVACMLKDTDMAKQFLSGKLIHQLNMKAFTHYECYLPPEEYPLHRNQRYKVFHSSSPKWLDFTPLHVAARYNRWETAKLLLNKGARIDVVTCVFPDSSYITGGMTALHVAHLFGHKKIVDMILQKHNGVKNVIDGYGLSQLHIACSRKNSVIVEKLLDHGAKSYKWRGNSLLTIALKHDRINNVKILLAHNETDLSGKPWLKKRSYRIIKHLVNEKLLRSSEAQFILRNACMKGYSHIVRLLLEYGTDVTNCSENHHAPLYYAIVMGQREVVKLLLSHWVSPYNLTHDGKNAMSVLLLRPVRKCLRDERILSRYRHTVISWLSQSGMETTVNQVLRDLVRDKSLESIAFLLEYTEDVNFLSHLISSLRSGQIERDFDEIFSIIGPVYNHMLKLIVIGKHPDDTAEQFFEFLTYHFGSRYHRNSSEFRKNCEKEYEEFKKTKLNESISLYDVVSETEERTVHPESVQYLEGIVKSNDFETKYPLYGWLIRLRAMKGRARCNLRELSKEFLLNLMGSKLPRLCILNIFKYLNENDLRFMMRMSGVTLNLDDGLK